MGGTTLVPCLAFTPMGAAEQLGLSLAQDAQDELDLADDPELAWGNRLGKGKGKDRTGHEQY